MAKIKNLVRKLRMQYNLTQEQLAKILKVSRQTISAIETGKYVPSLELALRIAKFFNKPVEEIFFFEEKENIMEQRPWGYFVNLLEEPGYKVKKLVIKPGQRISLQMHNYREEHWIIVQGEGTAIVGDQIKKVRKGDYVYIPKKTKHRLENTGQSDLIVIEVQIGDYLGEDDIIRFEDDYGRV